LVCVTHIFYFYFALERRNPMFGKMNVVPVVDLRNTPDEAGRCSDGAVKRLLDVTEHPKIERWIQFPKALFVFLVVPEDPESGAFYVYDRCAMIWFWLDFDDEKFGGYTVSDFDRLVRECRFLDIVERPHTLAGMNRWIVEPGLRPRQSRDVAEPVMNKPA
jgi:hypothetical protein